MSKRSNVEKQSAPQVKTVRIVAQRHGERQGDTLTVAGRKQIESIKRSKAFSRFNFVAYYASPKARALQTAQIVAVDSTVSVHYGLYPPLTDAQIDAIWGFAEKRSNTIEDWFYNLPRDWGLKMAEHMSRGIEEIIRECVKSNPDNNTLDIYLCAHSLTFEFLLPNKLQNTAPLKCGEYIVFQFEADGQKVLLVNSEIAGNKPLL